jgi:hypothetical protein
VTEEGIGHNTTNVSYKDLVSHFSYEWKAYKIKFRFGVKVLQDPPPLCSSSIFGFLLLEKTDFG